MMRNGVSLLSVIPVRKEPSEAAELETQILFGEWFEIMDEKEKWTSIRLFHDGYTGWVDSKMIHSVSSSIPSLEVQNPLMALNGLIEDLQSGYRFMVSAGSFLGEDLNEEGVFSIAGHPFRLVEMGVSLEELEVMDLCRKFLGSPYLWGGRHLMGIDCSGFSQIVMRLLKRFILRNASQQIKQGSAVAGLELTRAGDLAFFNNPEGRITHVGILTGKGTIIHASGWVREDRIDSVGILNRDSGNYSHQLHSIRRVL